MRKYRKSKKYYKYRNYILIFLSTLAIFVIGMYIFKYFNIDKDYVLKINNEYISKEEFLLYLDEQENVFEEVGGVDIWHTDFDGIPAKDVAKNNTISSIIFLKAVVYEAENLGIELTLDEKQQYKQEALLLKEYMEEEKNIIIPLEICEKFEKERIIEQKVYDYITSTFVVDEKEFEKYFNKYINDNINKINKINLDYIFIKNNDNFDAKQKANNIIKDINFKTDFNKFIEQPYVQVYKNIDLQKGLFEKNIEDKIYKLSEKSVSNVIEGRDGFYIFKINKILEVNIEDVKEMVREEYISIKKDEIYRMQTKNWVNNIKVEKNSEILSNI